jgi:CO dehydrogenase/acetyl-CoA synthase epsilon subunit
MSKVNVGQVCRALILKNEEMGSKMTNEELASRVVKIFEEQQVAVKTSAACVAWYKNDMRKKGILVGKSQPKSIELDLDQLELTGE